MLVKTNNPLSFNGQVAGYLSITSPSEGRNFRPFKIKVDD